MAKYQPFPKYANPKAPQKPRPDVLPRPHVVTVQDGLPLQIDGCEGTVVRVLHPSNPRAPSENFGVTMLYLPPHAELPSASHEPEECYAILQGEGTMKFTHGNQSVKKGDFIHLPAWAEHGLENTGIDMLVVLVATSPTNP